MKNVVKLLKIELVKEEFTRRIHRLDFSYRNDLEYWDKELQKAQSTVTMDLPAIQEGWKIEHRIDSRVSISREVASPGGKYYILGIQKGGVDFPAGADPVLEGQIATDYSSIKPIQE